MQFKTILKLNERMTIEANIEAKDLQEAVAQATPLLDFTGKCGMCGGSDITLRTRTTKEKGYKYTEYTCNTCGGKQPFGALQTGGFFLKDWQPKFQGNDAQA
jgi:hypothetical protein